MRKGRESEDETKVKGVGVREGEGGCAKEAETVRRVRTREVPSLLRLLFSNGRFFCFFVFVFRVITIVSFFLHLSRLWVLSPSVSSITVDC